MVQNKLGISIRPVEVTYHQLIFFIEENRMEKIC